MSELDEELYTDQIIVYIGVFAYGESRFELPFDPCKANIYRCVLSEANVDEFKRTDCEI